MGSTDYENMSRDDLIEALFDLHEELEVVTQKYEDLCYEVSQFIKATIWEHEVDAG